MNRRAMLSAVIALAIMGLGYFIWRNCIIALKPAENESVLHEERNARALSARTHRIDKNLVSLYFKNWDLRFKEGEVVETPTTLSVHTPVMLVLAVRQNNARGAMVNNVIVAFSTNTEGYSGVGSLGRFWQKTGRQDANEYICFIKETLPAGSSFDLPIFEVIFKTPGLYDMSYAIAIEGEETSQGRCVFHVV